MPATRRLYFAGPLFTHGELRWNREVAAELERAGHTVWLPQEKAGLAAGDGVPSAQRLFESAIEGIRQADVVVAVLDGADPDSGTSFECGYAWATDKPIVAVRTDFRRGGDDPDATVNLMLSQAARVVVVPARDADTAVTPFVRSIVSALAEIGGPDPAR